MNVRVSSSRRLIGETGRGEQRHAAAEDDGVDVEPSSAGIWSTTTSLSTVVFQPARVRAVENANPCLR